MKSVTLTLSRMILLSAMACIGSGLASASADPDSPVLHDSSVSQNQNIEDQPLGLQYSISATLGLREVGYHPVKAANDWTIDNPKQDYSAKISEAGFMVSAGEARLGLKLLSIGYGTQQTQLPEPVVEHQDNRLDYVRGSTTEWLVNGPMGLQHGFTLQSPPKQNASDTDALLTVRMTVDSNLDAQVSDDGLNFELLNQTGETQLSYGGLIAFDSVGKSMPARMQFENQQLRLVVDDRDAVYPLTIDPVIVNRIRHVATLSIEKGVIRGVPTLELSIGDDIAVLSVSGGREGKYYVEGSVYIYEKPENGWTGLRQASAKLAVFDYTSYGIPVEITLHGDTIIAQVSSVDIFLIGTVQSALIIYEKPANGWSGVIERTARISSPNSGDLMPINGEVLYFGDLFDFRDDVLVAYTFRAKQVVFSDFNNDRINTVDADLPEAYVYVKPASGWVDGQMPTTRLVVDDVYASTISVGREGSVVAIGTSADSQNGTNSGSVAVYQKPGDGWPESLPPSTVLLPSDGDADDKFGASVDVEANAILVGAPFDEVIGRAAGSAYLFTRPANGWVGTIVESARLLTSDAAVYKFLGSSVHFCGEDIILLRGNEPNEETGDGRIASAFVFYKPENGWNGTLVESARVKFSRGEGDSGEHPVITSNFDCNQNYVIGGNVASAFVFSLIQQGLPIAPIVDLILGD